MDAHNATEFFINVVSHTNHTECIQDPEFCGIHFGPSTPDLASQSYDIPDSYRFTLAGVYLAIAVAAALFVAAFVDDVSVFEGGRGKFGPRYDVIKITYSENICQQIS